MTTPECTDTSEFEKVVSIPSYLIDGKHYPIYQFIYSEPDACPSPHYHSATGTALPVDFVSINDPHPAGCGFGTNSMLPQYPFVTESDILEWESITGIDIPDDN